MNLLAKALTTSVLADLIFCYSKSPELSKMYIGESEANIWQMIQSEAAGRAPFRKCEVD